MAKSRRSARLTLVFMVGAVGVCLHEQASTARSLPSALGHVRGVSIGHFDRLEVMSGLDSQRSPSTECKVYADDQDDLLNRIFCLFFTRYSPSGRSYGGDILDPYLWSDTQDLVTGDRHETAVALLSELANAARPLKWESLRLAAFQRDLLAVRDWLGIEAISYSANRSMLKDVVERAIARLALTEDEISRLPDNYAAARRQLRSRMSRVQDSPERSVFEADLYDPNGDWICVGNVNGSPVARTHAKSFHGRSIFHVFLSVPGGRSAGRALLARMRSDFVSMTVADLHRVLVGSAHGQALPTLPTGTKLALVRRAVLVNKLGRRASTRLVEGIQVMTYGERRSSARIELSRTALFAHSDGGLVVLAPSDRRQTTFILHGGDPFERPASRDATQTSSYLGPGALEGCTACHEGPDLLSLLSVSRFRFGAAMEPVPALVESAPALETLGQMNGPTWRPYGRR